MTTAGDIVQQALREGNLIPVGGTPTSVEVTEGVGRLNSFLSALFGNELGEPLYEWPFPAPQRTAPVAANYPLAPGVVDLSSSVYPYPPANVRIMAKPTASATIYFPEAPSDGARMAFVDLGLTGVLTFDGNGRLIDSAATAVTPTVTSGTVWLYRADLGAWVTLATLASGDSSPLPTEFDDLLICGLAIRLAPRYGKAATAETASTYKSQLTKLRARYRQMTPNIGGAGDVPNSWQTYRYHSGSCEL